jgi:hypothetical protein
MLPIMGLCKMERNDIKLWKWTSEGDKDIERHRVRMRETYM